jgi:hypothetical protein
MKKSELRQLIREEIEKEMGGSGVLDYFLSYVDSLKNDIRLNGREQYENFTIEDFVEDFNEFVNDKMSS